MEGPNWRDQGWSGSEVLGAAQAGLLAPGGSRIPQGDKNCACDRKRGPEASG